MSNKNRNRTKYTDCITYWLSIISWNFVTHRYTYICMSQYKNAFWWFTIKHLKFYEIGGICELLNKVLKFEPENRNYFVILNQHLLHSEFCIIIKYELITQYSPWTYYMWSCRLSFTVIHQQKTFWKNQISQIATTLELFMR